MRASAQPRVAPLDERLQRPLALLMCGALVEEAGLRGSGIIAAVSKGSHPVAHSKSTTSLAHQLNHPATRPTSFPPLLP
jgi:hypothetical protein